MRVISGRCKGRKLTPVNGLQIRPTSDRVKEAVFNILGQKTRHASVLDLFAGTGALGIEALSRGAHHSTFIDQNCDILKKNITLCRLENSAAIIEHDLVHTPVSQHLGGQRFNLVFIDPPYGKGYIENILAEESFLDLLDQDGIIVAEQFHKERLEINLSKLDIYRQKKYSKTRISFITKL